MTEAKAEPVKQTKASAQILEAAIELFAACGYFGTTVRDISEKAEVTPMTVYRLFETKEKLFELALKAGIDRSGGQTQFLQTIFNHKESGSTDVRSFLTAAVRHWYESVHEQPARLMMYAYLSENEEWQRLAYEPLEKVIKALAVTLAEGVDKKAKRPPKVMAAARTLILSLFQFKITHPTIRTVRDEKATVNDILDQWWMGILPALR